MKAWRLEKPGGTFDLQDVPEPAPRPGGVLVDMRATPLLSYLRSYVQGDLPYWYPDKPFTPGTNGVGVVKAIGDGVYHLEPGQRVIVNPYMVAAEPVADPAQVLIGLTGISPDSGPLLTDWADGTLREVADFPAQTVIAAEGLDDIEDSRLATTGKFIVPLGGLIRGRLTAGETVIIHGATGYFGSGAVLLAVAMGAERVVAAGRNAKTLSVLKELTGDQVAVVQMTGDVEADTDALRDAAGGGSNLVFDMVGNADSANGTLAAMRTMRRGGRLVLMGSMAADIPLNYSELLLNNWEVIGNFMYRPDTYRVLLSLIRTGRLDLDMVSLRTFELQDLLPAMDAAGDMSGLDCTVVTF